ncbi:MAG: tetratricopeptide repeat protein [Candidatus Sericytochromatia bacterium]
MTVRIKAGKVEAKAELQHFEEAQQLQAQGLLDLAALHYQMALELAPDLTEAAYALGLLQIERHEYAPAIRAFKQVLDHNPVFAPAYFQLGQIYQRYFGAFEAALEYYQKTVKLDLQYTEAYFHAGFLCRELNQPAQAIQYFLKYLQFHPDRADILVVLGDLFLSMQSLDKAAQYYFRALQLEPEHPHALSMWLQIETGKNPEQTMDFLISLATTYPALRHLIAARVGILMESEYQWEEAQKCYQMALEDPALPDRLAWELKQGLILPLFPKSAEQQKQALQALSAHLARLSLLAELPETAQILPDFSNAEPYFSNWLPLNHLVYTEAEALVPRQQLARLLQRLLPPLPAAAQTEISPKRRVGFVFGPAHPALRQFFQLLLHLPSGLDLHWVFTDFFAFQSFQPLPPDCDYTLLSDQIPEALGQLLELGLDLLCFTEPHAEQSLQLLLASYRLAPVQFTSWLSPGTTGLPEMDYFISAAAVEPPDNPQRFYSETLIQLEALPVFFQPPAFILRNPEGRLWPRSDYGLPAEGALYLCPHLLAKLQPDFDLILAEILRRDRDGQVVLLTRPGGEKAREALLRRFETSLADVMPRIWFLPELQHDEYLNLLSLGSVMLDPRPCGAGTSVFEALSLGLPVITWPTEQAQGRVALAAYLKLGLPDCVVGSAEAYIEKALQLATNPELNQTLREKIRALAPALWEDPLAPEAWARCLKKLEPRS